MASPVTRQPTQMVTYRLSVLLRAISFFAPVLLTVSMVLALAETFSLPRFLTNFSILGLAWAGAVFACRVSARVGDGVVEVRRMRTSRLDLKSVERARRVRRGTMVELHRGDTVEFPLHLPGVVSPSWVIIDADVVESALKGGASRRGSIAELREAVEGKYLPRGFQGFPADD